MFAGNTLIKSDTKDIKSLIAEFEITKRGVTKSKTYLVFVIISVFKIAELTSIPFSKPSVM